MDETATAAPIWMLGVDTVELPGGLGSETLTPERVSDLRATLVALSAGPVATLKPNPARRAWIDRAASLSTRPARSFAGLRRSGGKVPKAAPDEVLYRMVVPAKVADQFGKGLVRSMPSKGVAGGIRGPLVGKGGIRANASFVPVTQAVAAGGLAAAAGPLILMGLVVGLGAYADQQQQQAIQALSELLKKLDEHNLDSERAELEGCHDAVESATALLLDGAKIGHSVGFDSAVSHVDTAVARARRRLTNWNAAVANLPRTHDGRVEVHRLIDAFPGIDKGGGEFQAHLELAAAAIALKRRVNLLQALDHAQLNPENRFDRFTRRMAESEASFDALEAVIRAMLHDVVSVDLTRPRRKRSVMYTMREMDSYLSALQKVRALAAGVDHVGTWSDVAIEMVREADGTMTVLPALPA